jgi:hypothetical protein
MILLVNDASTSRHPLHVTLTDDSRLASGVVVFHLALKGNRDRLRSRLGKEVVRKEDGVVAVPPFSPRTTRFSD